MRRLAYVEPVSKYETRLQSKSINQLTNQKPKWWRKQSMSEKGRMVNQSRIMLDRSSRYTNHDTSLFPGRVQFNPLKS